VATGAENKGGSLFVLWESGRRISGFPSPAVSENVNPFFFPWIIEKMTMFVEGFGIWIL